MGIIFPIMIDVFGPAAASATIATSDWGRDMTDAAIEIR